MNAEADHPGERVRKTFLDLRPPVPGLGLLVIAVHTKIAITVPLRRSGMVNRFRKIFPSFSTAACARSFRAAGVWAQVHDQLHAALAV